MSIFYHSRRHRSRGFTLIEIMIAMIIGLVLIGGVIQVFLGQRASHKTQEALSRLQENARFALSVLVKEISKSGHMGCLTSSDDVVNTLSAAADPTFSFEAAIGGTDSNGVGPNGEDWDQIQVRSAGASQTSPALAIVSPPDIALGGTAPITLDPAASGYSDLVQYDIFAVGDCTAAAIFMITNDPSASGGVIEHEDAIAANGHPTTDNGMTNVTEDLQHQFGALQSSVATGISVTASEFLIQNNASGDPALFLNGREIVDGIVGMEILYGEDLAPLDLTADRYVNATEIDASGDWNNVTSVRVTLTVSSVDTLDDSGALTREITTTIKLRGRGV
ncbi:MAG TPA: prepilin-type N-terminal cleavage/methylation domain-containing protein [Chromatiaceae bacterium]|jgi:type IV pilus assembly protein PilW|nr:prepilin-type N-terminal cleavage/methylation domain-containing protein [Chromatiaceae bacterium]HIO13623.1 prepilin-type N-terminal cleavage/methylation domain-containing protein [Chromatiales bacterium]